MHFLSDLFCCGCGSGSAHAGEEKEEECGPGTKVCILYIIYILSLLLYSYREGTPL